MHCNFTPFPVLVTDRLVMRQIELGDDEVIFYERTDKTINKYIDRPPAANIDEAREWINMISGGITANDLIAWGVTLKGDTALIGGFCLWNLSKETDTAEIGFSLHPPFWGKGLMQEAVAAGLQYGFERMQLQAIEAQTHHQNASSVKLLERNGFVRTGADGNYVIYTLTADVYAKPRPAQP